MPEETVVYSPEELSKAYNALKSLDPEGAGLTMDKLRPMMPGVNWNKLRGILMALVNEETPRAAYKLRKPAGAKVQYEFFTWL